MSNWVELGEDRELGWMAVLSGNIAAFISPPTRYNDGHTRRWVRVCNQHNSGSAEVTTSYVDGEDEADVLFRAKRLAQKLTKILDESSGKESHNE